MEAKASREGHQGPKGVPGGLSLRWRLVATSSSEAPVLGILVGEKCITMSEGGVCNGVMEASPDMKHIGPSDVSHVVSYSCLALTLATETLAPPTLTT